ncbi:hypothetical protein GNI_068450 [Gregarina niphandrodes]|uniref:Uncharacterized protein n=1 Tax=Gregarina niphandrodes TaxID=110365 RepID=A0A023B7J4_GRENI|nr:hypothetical protein GNI_068450 [Gregarina niphandrodes]EZG67506.1 hypothetical protein GNI_068450 [Gregarina niphandrodes]|eukprot:XP_011130221.1 hypothetical protein GNI_068450 [Gregarina niphandrodes]
MSDLLRLRVYLDSSVIDHIDKTIDPRLGVWIFVVKDSYQTISEIEMRSTNCRLPLEAPVKVLLDAQEITICLISSGDGDADRCAHAKRRRHHSTPPKHHTPLSVPFSASPGDEKSTADAAIQRMRKRFRRKDVPDWALSKLPETVLVSDKGIPQSGIEGVTWKVSASKIGWQARFKNERAMFSLDQYEHAEALELARKWLLDQKSLERDNSERAVKDEDSCEESESSFSGDGTKERSQVRGVALCKGSWKARWRDSNGRQRMKTFGPGLQDKLAAEKFIKEVRATLQGKKMQPISVPTTTDFNILSCASEDFFPETSSSSNVLLKQEDTKEVLASLLNG